MTLIDKAEVRWPVRGYAPGAYSCKCRKCGQAFIGDKRAYQCQDCVIQDLAALPARGVGVPQIVIDQLNVTVGEVGLEMVQDAEDAEFTGERPDLHDYQVSIPYDHAVAILAALTPTDAAQAPFRIEDMTLADLMRDPLYEEATTPAPDAALAREAAARLLLDMLHMRNGAHEGVTKDDAQAMWEAASTRVGYAAVDAFLRSIIGEARP